MSKKPFAIWMSDDTYRELKRLGNLPRRCFTDDEWDLSRVGIEYVIQCGVSLIKKYRKL